VVITSAEGKLNMLLSLRTEFYIFECISLSLRTSQSKLDDSIFRIPNWWAAASQSAGGVS